MEYVNDTIVVTHCKETHRPNFDDIIDRILELKRKYGYINNIIVDSANPEVITALKIQFNERYDEQYIKDKIFWCKQNNQHLENYMLIVPRSFSVEGKQMLQHLSSLLDQNLIAIPPRYEDLINGLRAATAVEWKYQKESSPYNDLVDALRLNVSYYKFGR